MKSGLEGWACGSNGTVLHTMDGGASWAATTPFAFSKDLYDVDFEGPNVYVAGTYAFLAASADAGASWTAVDLRIASRSDVGGLSLLPDGALWLCGGGGFLRRTTDGGRSFFFPRHPVMTGLSDVFFQDAAHGWACAGRSKLVARTTDGGATWSVPGGGAFTCTWTSKVSNGSASIRGNTLTIDPFNRDKLYAVQGKTVLASWDLGENWRPVATISGTGSRTNAFLVSPTDTLTWLALIQDGDRIARTTDGGLTWTAPISIAFTEYGLPMEQDPDHPQEVYFGPEDGRIWKSVDFGATWFQLSNPGFRSPDDIVVVADTTGIMYVSDGVTGLGNAIIWKSSDGGLTWAAKQTVVGSEVPMIAASRLDKHLAYATDWPAGGVQRSTDAGETWVDVRPTYSEWGADIAKDDLNVALTAVYSGGVTHLTIDRGQTWLTAAIGGSNYGVLTYDRATYFAHQSGGVWKATISQPDMPVDNTQLLTLAAPNGGETWQYGSTETISWSSQNFPALNSSTRPGRSRPGRRSRPRPRRRRGRMAGSFPAPPPPGPGCG